MTSSHAPSHPVAPQQPVAATDEGKGETAIATLIVVLGLILGIAGSSGRFDATPINSRGETTGLFSEDVVRVHKGAQATVKMIGVGIGMLGCAFGIGYFGLVVRSETAESSTEKPADDFQTLAYKAKLQRQMMLEEARTQAFAQTAEMEVAIEQTMTQYGLNRNMAEIVVRKAFEEDEAEQQRAAQEQAKKDREVKLEQAKTAMAQAVAAKAKNQNTKSDSQPSATTTEVPPVTSTVESPADANNANGTNQIEPDALRLLLGYTPDGKAIHYAPAMFNNGFIVGVGASGSGKTTLARALAIDLLEAGRKILFLAFHDDMQALPGVPTLVVNNFRSDFCVNPFALTSTEEKHGGPRHQKTVAIAMIESIAGLGNQQVALFRQLVDLMFSAKGIKDQDPSTWSILPPTPADILTKIVDYIGELQETKSINASLKRGESRVIPDVPVFARNEDRLHSLHGQLFKMFSHPVFEGEPYDMNKLVNSSHLIDMSALGIPEIQFMISDTILRAVVQILDSKPAIAPDASDVERFNYWMMSDEAKFCMPPSSKEDVTAPVPRIAMDLRKKGGCIAFFSQSLEHFSPMVLKQVGARIILSIEDEEIQQLCKVMSKLTPAMLEQLQPKGDAWFVTKQGDPIRMRVEPPADSPLPTRRKRINV